jgi:uncharacterized protein (DUF58 family)
MGPEDYRQFRESKIQLFSRIKLKNIFPGEWESIYTGEGIEFAAIRPLEPGDDLHDLDLHTLVQSGEEEIIERVVERQMRVCIWVDFSGSTQRFDEMLFPQKPEIKDIAIGLLLFSASNAYSPVGLYAFNKGLSRFFPARSGERHCWEILNWVIDQQYQGSIAPADIEGAVSFLMQRVFPQSLVFFVSDFQDRVFEGDFTDLLRAAARRFDFVPVVIRDPLEKQASLGRPVTIAVRNSEGEGRAEIYLTPEKLREMQEISARHLLHLERNFRAVGVEHVVLDSPSIEECHRVLTGFFEGRKRIRV